MTTVVGDNIGNYTGNPNSFMDSIIASASEISRHLAEEYSKKKDDYSSKSTDIDYTVFKVGILTLGLILMLELLRHKVDVSAKNRPFFHEVLHVFYSELAILGIVEFAVFLILEYHKKINKDQKYLFARVHFMLFYTAVINITQSVIIAIFTHKVSRRMWVDTEQLELNHYVALREEFDEVEAKVNFSGFNSNEKRNVLSEIDNDQKDHLAEDTFSLRKWWKYAKIKIKSPALMSKYEKLLVQVRFHELRVHFIKANDLPLKFKVSEYLQKSQLHVLVHMVHVGSFAWLTLMGVVNLIYFLMSVVAWVNSQQIEKSLKGMFIGFCCLIVLASVVLIEKMKWIFAYIMHTRLIDTNAMKDDAEQNNNRQRSSSKLTSTTQQLDLFWFSNPSLVTGCIQLMQFGYSIFASVLIMFWKDLDKSGYVVTGVILSGICFGSWIIFIVVIAQVIPRYTLCTSLGQLVNVKTMRECLAKYSLQEAVKKRKKQIEKAEKEAKTESVTENKSAQRRSSSIAKTIQTSTPDSRSNHTQRSIRRGHGSDSDSESDSGSTNLSKLADLVTKPTKDLPKLNHEELARTRSQRKSKRRRALSDGVAAMRVKSERVLSGLDSSIHKEKSTQESIRNMTTALQIGGNGANKEAKNAQMNPSEKIKVGENNIPRRTARLKKSVSANVALMRSPTSSLFAPESEINPIKNGSLGFNEPSMNNDNGGSRAEKNGALLDAVLEDIPARSYLSSKKTQLATNADDKVEGRENKSENYQPKQGLDSKNHEASDESRDESSYIEMVCRGNGAAVTRNEVLSCEESAAAYEGSDEASSTQSSERNYYAGESENTKTNGAVMMIDIRETSDSSPTKIEDMVVRTKRRMFSMESAKAFLLTGYYRKLSGVCGSMVCFFFVGVRMETLLVSSGAIAQNPSTMQIPGHVPFWMELVWLSMFILVSAFTAMAFCPRATRKGNVAMCVAGFSDIVLSSTCLMLLVLSETQRTTGSFGSKERLKDGVGLIEPFTSLIALRVLRFRWGKYIVKLWEGKNKRNGYPTEITVKKEEVRARRSSSIVTHREKEKVVDPHPFDMTHNKGTVVELWRTALSHYPQIVEEHGEFSSELLQAMLGIPCFETGTKRKDIKIS